MNHKTYFLEQLFSNLGAAAPQKTCPEVIQNIASNHLDDLTTIQNQFFSEDTKSKMTQMAAQEFAKKIHKNEPEIYKDGAFKNSDYQLLMGLWNSVVQDFYRNNFWNFATLSQPEKKAVLVDKNKVKTRRFLFTAIQSLVIMKIAILYFGANYSIDPTPANRNKLIAAIAVALSSMGYFIFKNYKDE